MPDEILRTGAEFDPTGVVKGVTVSVDALKQFRAQLEQLATHLPQLSIEDIIGGVREGVDDVIKDFERMQRAAQESADGIAQSFRVTSAEAARLRTLASGLQQGGGAGGSTLPTDRQTQGFIDNAVAARRAAEGEAAWAAGAAQVGAEAALARVGLDRMNAGFAAAAAQTRAVHPMAEAMSRVTQTTETAAAAVSHAGHSSAQTAQHFVTLAAASIGAETGIARVAATMLGISVGFTKIAAGAAVIFAIAKAYEILTAASRRAKQEQDDLVKSIQDRARAERQANEAAGIAAIDERIAKLKAEADAVAKTRSEYSSLSLVILLRVLHLADIGKLEEAVRDRNQEQARINRDTMAARRAGLAEVLNDELAIARAQSSGREQAARTRAELAGLGQQHFGAQPGFVSDEEKRATLEQIENVKKLAAAELAVLFGRRALAVAAQSDLGPNATEAEKQRAKDAVESIDRQIRLMQLQANLRVQAIRDEERLAGARRKAAAEEEAHLRRVALHGGGNILGAVPGVSLGSGQSGFPTAAELEAQRKAALPPILQGARQQGLETGVLGHAQEDIDNARALRREIEGVADAIVTAATNALGLSQNLSESLQAGVGLFGAFRQLNDANAALRAAKKTGDTSDDLGAQLGQIAAVGGVIGTGIGLLGGLGKAIFGQSELEREHIEQIKQNNQRLADMKISLDASLQGGSGLSKIGGILDTDTIIRIINAANVTTSDQLNEALASASLSLTDFARIVEQATGIKILDSKGHIIGEAWDQARHAIDLAREAATRFANTVQAHAAQISERNRIFGVSGASASIGANREALLGGLNLDPAEEARVRAFDLATKEGQDAYRQWLQQLFALAAAGKITVEQLGQFANVDEVIATAADGADAVAQAQEEAAQKIKDAADKQAQAAAEAAASFQQNFGTLQDIARQLSGNNGPAAQFHDAMTHLAEVAPDAFAEVMGNIDLNDPAARDAFRQRLLSIVNEMLAGQANVEGMGLDPSEFAAFIQFAQTAAASLDELSQVTDRLADAESRRDLRAKLAGPQEDRKNLTDEQRQQAEATDEFVRQLQALTEIAPKFADKVDDFDLAGKEGRESLRKRLLKMFDQFTAGTLKPSDLGLSESDFLTFMGQAADYLAAFNDSVKDATKSLTNIPQNFNPAEFEWWTRQQIPGRPQNLPTIGPGLGPTPITSPGDPVRTGSGTIRIDDPVAARSRAPSGASLDRLAQLLENGPLVNGLEKFATAMTTAQRGNTEETARRIQEALDYIAGVRPGGL